ncbi:hypothetical protein Acy02nite_48090 [Actinoplanes cyaneus]|uniref:Lipoprotein n=1 Tax=Actinoplanes cyaneus TaxID=52696 RepID=A0A919IP34_9ACTN|nr:hypothetical protein [Actinoplanes cyaneus]MCW2138747.1 hypothetical protein [Actinoplanes cyaneus]GID66928.1 hypothetical protein Acy02nite_48090 [Actinoplanes cyaneus]
MFTRTFAVLIAATGLTFGAAACSSTSASQATAPTPQATAPTAAPASSAAAPAPTASKAAAKVAPVTTKTTASDSECPATEATLLAAWEIKSGHAPIKGTRLTKIACHDGWAIAGFEPPGQESEVDSFHYVGGKWTYLGGGSAGYCAGIPAAVQKHFATHGPRACDSTGL